MSLKPSEFKILCTICARAGSKGVKNKNIRDLLNKPLIAYTIEQALRWGGARHVVVSTDSEKIAAVAKQYGAEAPFLRPAILAGDSSPKIPSIRHALIQSERIFNEKFNIVLDLDPSAPLRRIEDIDNCLEIFMKEKPRSLFSVVKAEKNPYFNMVERKPGGFVELCKSLPLEITSRQEAPAVYSLNASIYFYSREFLLNPKVKTPFSSRSSIYIMDSLSRYDIDSETDLKFINFLMKEGVWKNEL